MTWLGKSVAFAVIASLFLVAWFGHQRQQQLARESQVDFQSVAELNNSKGAEAEASSSSVSNPFGLSADSDLDSVLSVALDLLQEIDSNVLDYRATLISRERVGGVLKEEARMRVKVRQPTPKAGLSVYLKFLAPTSTAGREIIWVEDQNEGRIVAHEAGLRRMIGTLELDPHGRLAMLGQKYPICDIGIANLAQKLIEKGESEKEIGQAIIHIVEDQEVDGKVCDMIEVVNPTDNGKSEFHIARVYLDRKLRIPVKYAAYLWPDSPDNPPVLEEEYTYVDLELNVGLTDKDFDRKNSDYDFP
ncbi:MAG: DUF1571 domain-containing protein [Pirellulaceae bacterium]